MMNKSYILTIDRTILFIISKHDDFSLNLVAYKQIILI